MDSHETRGGITIPNQKYPPAHQRSAMLPEPPGNPTPLISYFAGIFIRVRYGDNEQRLYAEYAGDTAIFDSSGNLLEGQFPEMQKKYVWVWADIHRHDLMVLWKLMQTEDAYFKIKGLD